MLNVICPDNGVDPEKNMTTLDQDFLPPIFVRDSRVLLSTDLFWEAICLLLKQQPWMIVVLFCRLFRGREYFQARLVDRLEFSPQWLVYNQKLVSWLQKQRQTGRQLILVTDFSRDWAEEINAHLHLFDRVVSCSTDRAVAAVELQRVAAAIKGSDGQFVFAGTAADFPVWQAAAGAVIVSCNPGLKEQVGRITAVEECLTVLRPTLFDYLRAMRVHQWLKNCLIFVPLVTSHGIGDPASLLVSSAAFLSFSFCASAVYLINDLSDLPSDRNHNRKKNRPFAAGTLQLNSGAVLVPLFLLLSFGIASFLPGKFFLVLSVYFIMTLAYTFRLKKVVLVDVIMLAGLYTLRIIAGGTATGVVLSFWLLAFSVFIFFSLALVKRYSELLHAQSVDLDALDGRGYLVEDQKIIRDFGIASGYMSVLVLALYINSEDVRLLYSQPQLIWLLCPLLLYWISRMWLITARGHMYDDPVLFAIQDHVSQAILVLGIFILWLAI
jgi:4-hydroxybenzoate polyprenyltransferase